MSTKRCMSDNTSSDTKRAREPACPICLHPMEDLTLLESCSHQFCFDCIRKWLIQKPTCPLCKARAQVLKHNFKCIASAPAWNDNGKTEIVREIVEEVEFRRLNEHTWPLTTEEELIDQAIRRLLELLTARFNPLSDGAEPAIFHKAPSLIKLLVNFRSSMARLPRPEVISSLIFRFVVYFMDADRHTLLTTHTDVKLSPTYVEENRIKLRTECLPFVVREMRAITSLSVFNTSLLMDLLLDSLSEKAAQRDRLFVLLKQYGVDHPRTFLKNVKSFASSDQSMLLYDSNSRFKCRTALSSVFTDDSDVQIISAPQNGDVEFVGESIPNSRSMMRHMPYDIPSTTSYAYQNLDQDIEVIHETRLQPYFQQLDSSYDGNDVVIDDEDDDIVIDDEDNSDQPQQSHRSSTHDEIVL